MFECPIQKSIAWSMTYRMLVMTYYDVHGAAQRRRMLVLIGRWLKIAHWYKKERVCDSLEAIMIIVYCVQQRNA